MCAATAHEPARQAATAVMSHIEFQILGPVRVVVGGRPVALGGPRRERILAALVLAAGPDQVGAARLLRRALALWRGAALAGLDCDQLHKDIAGLDDARLTAHEECLGRSLPPPAVTS